MECAFKKFTSREELDEKVINLINVIESYSKWLEIRYENIRSENLHVKIFSIELDIRHSYILNIDKEFEEVFDMVSAMGLYTEHILCDLIRFHYSKFRDSIVHLPDFINSEVSELSQLKNGLVNIIDKKLKIIRLLRKLVSNLL
jgi:hypothetical protein